LLEARDDTGLLANLPLGIDVDVPDYEELSLTLDVNDLVLCYTDALIESRDESGELLCESGLLDMVRRLDLKEPEHLIRDLTDRISQRQAGQTVEDDVTILLFRANGLAPRVPLRDKLLAPFRILKGVASSIVTRGPMPLPDLSIASIGGAMIDSLNRAGKPAARKKVI
jgi:hypothetical protein